MIHIDWNEIWTDVIKNIISAFFIVPLFYFFRTFMKVIYRFKTDANYTSTEVIRKAAHKGWLKRQVIYLKETINKIKKEMM